MRYRSLKRLSQKPQTISQALETVNLKTLPIKIDLGWVGCYFQGLIECIYERNYALGYYIQKLQRKYPGMDETTTNQLLNAKRSLLPNLSSEEQTLLATYLNPKEQLNLIKSAQLAGQTDYYTLPIVRAYGRLN